MLNENPIHKRENSGRKVSELHNHNFSHRK